MGFELAFPGEAAKKAGSRLRSWDGSITLGQKPQLGSGPASRKMQSSAESEEVALAGNPKWVEVSPRTSEGKAWSSPECWDWQALAPTKCSTVSRFPPPLASKFSMFIADGSCNLHQQESVFTPPSF